MTDNDALARLSSVERVSLQSKPTPLVELHLPEVAKRNLRLFLKREDLGGLGGGGNKLRKLEVALADARKDGADTIITFGALQSNHARLTAAAAAHLGLQCELILSRKVRGQGASYDFNGNILLSELLGAKLHILDDDVDASDYAMTLANNLRNDGRIVRTLPFGGSDLHGTLGMAQVSVEISAQLGALGLTPATIAVASGSGSTQAGLSLGAELTMPEAQVLGLSILEHEHELRETVAALMAEGFAYCSSHAVSRSSIAVDDRFIGSGYGQTYGVMMESMMSFSRRTGILLDPVYSGKAMHAFLTRIGEGLHDSEQTLVFVHTGGIQGLFAYAEALRPHLGSKTGVRDA